MPISVFPDRVSSRCEKLDLPCRRENGGAFFRDPARAEGSSSPAHVGGRVLSVSRRIFRCPYEPVPDARREHGVGRYRGGAARRGGRALLVPETRFLDSQLTPEPFRRGYSARVSTVSSRELRARDAQPRSSSTDTANRAGYRRRMRVSPRVFLASETILARAACPFQWRPRTRRRCLTPHATMNPAAYPDGRWSTGSHTSSGARPVTQRCDSHPSRRLPHFFTAAHAAAQSACRRAFSWATATPPARRSPRRRTST